MTKEQFEEGINLLMKNEHNSSITVFLIRDIDKHIHFEIVRDYSARYKICDGGIILDDIYYLPYDSMLVLGTTY